MDCFVNKTELLTELKKTLQRNKDDYVVFLLFIIFMTSMFLLVHIFLRILKVYLKLRIIKRRKTTRFCTTVLRRIRNPA